MKKYGKFSRVRDYSRSQADSRQSQAALLRVPGMVLMLEVKVLCGPS